MCGDRDCSLERALAASAWKAESAERLPRVPRGGQTPYSSNATPRCTRPLAWRPLSGSKCSLGLAPHSPPHPLPPHSATYPDQWGRLARAGGGSEQRHLRRPLGYFPPPPHGSDPATHGCQARGMKDRGMTEVVPTSVSAPGDAAAWAEALSDMAQRASARGIHPLSVADGTTCGVYFLRNPVRRIGGMFKPGEEEPGAGADGARYPALDAKPGALPTFCRPH